MFAAPDRRRRRIADDLAVVDVDAYDLTIDSPAGTLRIDATSATDGIRLAVLGLTVDLAE